MGGNISLTGTTHHTQAGMYVSGGSIGTIAATGTISRMCQPEVPALLPQPALLRTLSLRTGFFHVPVQYSGCPDVRAPRDKRTSLNKRS